MILWFTCKCPPPLFLAREFQVPMGAYSGEYVHVYCVLCNSAYLPHNIHMYIYRHMLTACEAVSTIADTHGIDIQRYQLGMHTIYNFTA